MSEIVWSTIQLYQHALQGAAKSFKRCWLIVVAVVIFVVLMIATTTLAVSLGMLGGFLLGATNAFIVGWMLSLVEQGIMGSRVLQWKDIWSGAGQYFWDVITIGFIVWVPLQVLEMGMATNPYGPALTSAVFLLLFLLLNPVPEIIYQGRQGSPLEIIKESYEFVLENWIEWFLPMAIILAPLGLTFFFALSSQSGRMMGLDFIQLLRLPFTVLTIWFMYIGIPESLTSILVLILTPITTVFVLFFRGHLFAALHGSSRRQRLFKAGAGGR